ncbi:DinB family protein [Tenacibaculum sp. M341]|uniref:DinB family protein n=1 Tax=Tenacibaculum sp. M341 TaxID=2530339 RepID=UPI00104AAFD0|nr:DinB family protein [Tenacibaculum sp. M341]TCI95039.1 DinB family protein [Tenacibaculum sp. M341]
MDKQQINEILEEKHQMLFNWIAEQPTEKWLSHPEGKWTAGQHIAHLVNSIKQVNYAMSLPKFILKYKFGKANRSVRTYNHIVERYDEKLAKNQEKAKAFNSKLKVPPLKQRDQLLATLLKQQKKLQKKTNKWSDKDLDNIILPHPLMGKMPVREIIMWTAHHTEHHTKDLIENY